MFIEISVFPHDMAGKDDKHQEMAQNRRKKLSNYLFEI